LKVIDFEKINRVMQAIHDNIHIMMPDILNTGLIRVPFKLLHLSQNSFTYPQHFLQNNIAIDP